VSKYVPNLSSIDKIYFIQGYDPLCEDWGRTAKHIEETYKYKEFRFLTISKYLKNRMHEHGKKDVTVIYNSINTNCLKRVRNKKEADAVGVIYRGNYSKKLINFINYLKKYKRSDLKYYCIGRNIKKEHAKLFDCVMDGSEFKQMVNFYNKIGMLVIPSEEEGFSLPVLESMMCGTPVAIKNIGIAYELVRNKENSIIMGSNTPEAIKDSINFYASLSNEKKLNMQKLAYESVNAYCNKIKRDYKENLYNFYVKN